MKNEEYTPVYSWSIGSHLFPLSQGKIAVTLRDAQSCFNLNALAQLAKVSGAFGGKQLISLISRLDVPAQWLHRLLKVFMPLLAEGVTGRCSRKVNILPAPCLSGQQSSR
ncbi:TPA: general secretion pathway protein GspK [Escherichia coli]|nr:general secretion pathway protein GspK [Escherichia coli]